MPEGPPEAGGIPLWEAIERWTPKEFWQRYRQIAHEDTPYFIFPPGPTPLQEEANRLGVTFRYVHVRGTTFGRSLLWPFEPGYACEAAIGPEGHPSGIYLNVPPRTPHG